MKADGIIDKYKASLVIKGYRQNEGLDYFDTFSPVSRINSIRMILEIAALRNLKVHQMDVKTVFLNGNLDEEIYMEQLESHVVLGQKRKVCKLVKSLYGIKQASKQWHKKFDNVMMANGFKINEYDKYVYVKPTDIGYIIICLYVDDILIVGSNNEMVKHTKDMLNSRFDMKDIGLTNVILGIQIKRSSKCFVMTQPHNVDKVLAKFSKDDSGKARTPIDTSHHLSKKKVKVLTKWNMQRYCFHCEKFKQIHKQSRGKPLESNCEGTEISQIYLGLRLHYSRDPAILEGFSDAS
ncbi:dynamin-related protein 4C-like [Gossypium australe]|uniref:Dynamin-related protein 4C-like n=1 Tax=Gossypium australe TaxID=47621 RepID=A0A5B6VJ10_9ROSI|nr:dynamin-related protein 4C-like [Gossypium australe]